MPISHFSTLGGTSPLPEAVDDYVGRDNPVRFIDAFVDGLDLAVAGFERAAPKATGRPGYDPADLLKLYIYGYLNRVRSSRRLEAESKRNLEVIWLLRRLSPDFKTIADFRGGRQTGRSHPGADHRKLRASRTQLRQALRLQNCGQHGRGHHDGGAWLGHRASSRSPRN